MDTDRELLEAAARAAGLGLPDKDDTDEIDRQYEFHLGLWCKFPWGWQWFRPHMDDGQALRLAVKLRLDIDFEKSYMVSVWSRHLDDWVIERCDDEMGTDIAEKTRRAIVRAAAVIGRNMK